MAHDPAVVDIKRGGKLKHPGAGFMLANFYTTIICNACTLSTFNSRVVQLHNDFRFRASSILRFLVAQCKKLSIVLISTQLMYAVMIEDQSRKRCMSHRDSNGCIRIKAHAFHMDYGLP